MYTILAIRRLQGKFIVIEGVSLKGLMKNIIKNITKIFQMIGRIKARVFRGNNLYFFVFFYFVLLSGIMISYGQFFSPDRFIIAGLVLAIIVANPFSFIKDWLPFIFLLLSYEFLRGLAPRLNETVNIYPLIDADKFFFFGHLPTVSLQNIFYTPGIIRFYDYLFTVLYLLHFVLPLVFAFLLWMKRKECFGRFAIALLVLSYAGFATYILYPAMPPWMAADQGIIPPVYNIFYDTAANFLQGGALPSVYSLFNPNPVAAMPSLHAAYPMLVFLYLLKYFGKKAWWFFIYVLAVWVGIVYLGHHYVIDALAGGIYAMIIFYAIEYLYDRRKKKLSVRKAVADSLV